MRLTALIFSILVLAGPAFAQDDGPRVYQLVPKGAQAFTAFAVAKRGDETPEPGSVIPGADIDTDILVFRYVRTFDLAGRQFSPFVIVPVGEARTTTHSAQGSSTISSSGFGDSQIGASVGLIGAPALSGEDYAVFAPPVSVHLLARAFLPTGDYSSARPVNFGSNRLSWQLGLPTTFMLGHAYGDADLTALEVMPTLTWYAANDDPYGAGRQSKDPLLTVEAHLTHNLSRKVWISADLLYRQGGATTTDGAPDHNAMHGLSAGGSLAFPLAPKAVLILTYQQVVARNDDGPDGGFFRTALVVPF